MSSQSVGARPSSQLPSRCLIRPWQSVYLHPRRARLLSYALVGIGMPATVAHRRSHGKPGPSSARRASASLLMLLQRRALHKAAPTTLGHTRAPTLAQRLRVSARDPTLDRNASSPIVFAASRARSADDPSKPFQGPFSVTRMNRASRVGFPSTECTPKTSEDALAMGFAALVPRLALGRGPPQELGSVAWSHWILTPRCD